MTTLEAHGLPALRPEPFAPLLEDHYRRVQLQLNGFNDGRFLRAVQKRTAPSAFAATPSTSIGPSGTPVMAAAGMARGKLRR